MIQLPELVWELLTQMAYFFPWYVALVLVPAAVRIVIERVAGIRVEEFMDTVLGIGVTYESAFKDVVLVVLYFPLFEELVFRGLPYLLFGTLGIAVGSAVWVVMHPAWQLQYVRALPIRKKVLFTVTSTAFYACTAAFYSMMWVAGAGLAAILYHIAHNGWLTLADLLKEVELPAPWKKYRFVRPAVAGVKKRKVVKEERKEEREEKEEESGVMRFVVRKSTRSLSQEVEEVKKYIFVRRKK